MVTIYPRFLVKNKSSQVIRVKQYKSENVLTIQPGERLPVLQLERDGYQQLAVAYGAQSSWSAPFKIQDIGRTFVRLAQKAASDLLLSVEIILDDAILHIQIDEERATWPFELRNDSSVELVFFQTVRKHTQLFR